MTKKYLVALDDGHGMETAGKRTPPIPELDGRVIRENEFNKAVKHFLADELKRCGIDVLFVAPGDKDVSLTKRTNLANSKNADIYISIHYNAYDGKFKEGGPEGHSLHIYPKSKEGRRLAECIMKYLPLGTKQRNRGIRENNFHVLRETNMPAVLSENGFMDNKREALLMIDKDFQKEVAREHAQGICDYFGVKFVPEDKKEVYPAKSVTLDSPTKDIRWAQRQLNKVLPNWLPLLAEDGIYGPKTRIAVLVYWEQLGWGRHMRDNGTGIGKATRKALAGGRKK